MFDPTRRALASSALSLKRAARFYKFFEGACIDYVDQLYSLIKLAFKQNQKCNILEGEPSLVPPAESVCQPPKAFQ